jgi:Uncharacterized protein conserved in bacteria (DUF2314)
MTRTVRNGEPDIYSIGTDDEEMNKAIATAQQTFYQFESALKSNRYDTGTFALKVKFPTSTGHEHIYKCPNIVCNF